MTIKLLQWNVWYKEDPQKIVNLIKQHNPDIICAQELIQHFQTKPEIDTAKQIAREIGYQYYFHYADRWTNRSEKETQGNAIFSKLPIISTNHHFLHLPKTDPINATEEGRVLVEITVNLAGKELTLGTTHLSFTPFFEMTAHRRKEAKNLVKYLATQISAPYVFTGDLNATPDSFLVKELAKLAAFKSAGPDPSVKTWTTKPFSKQGFVADELNWRLDYVFVTQDLKVKQTEVISTDVSDHLPVLVELELN